MGLTHFAVSLGSEQRVDELTKRLRDDGHTILDAVRAARATGTTKSVVLDPDGNRVEIVARAPEGVSRHLRVRAAFGRRALRFGRSAARLSSPATSSRRQISGGGYGRTDTEPAADPGRCGGGGRDRSAGRRGADPRGGGSRSPDMGTAQAPPITDVKGKVAYITGGSSGIGLGIARVFHEAGMKVVHRLPRRAAHRRCAQACSLPMIRVSIPSSTT